MRCLHHIFQNQHKYPHEILGIPLEEISWDKVRAFCLASTEIALVDGERPIVAKDFSSKNESD